jgi:hypothetical protein
VKPRQQIYEVNYLIYTKLRGFYIGSIIMAQLKSYFTKLNKAFNFNKYNINNNKSNKMPNPGYIYIFSNNEFKSDVYKIGNAQNVFKRMNAFTAAYVKPLKIEYISDKCNNYSVAEHEVHLRLNGIVLRPTANLLMFV